MMMREVLNGAANLPDEILLKLHEIKDVLAGIIGAGVREGRFRDANAFMTHMLITGTLMLYATGEPMRKRMSGLCNENGQEFCIPGWHQIIAQVTDMIQHSLKTRSARDGVQ